jgi:hypothetical protein
LRPYNELKTPDRDRFFEAPDGCDYPVYAGRNVNQFMHAPLDERGGIEPPSMWSVEEDSNPDTSAKRRIREKNVRTLKRALYNCFDGSGTQKQFVNELLKEHRGEGLIPEDVLLDCTEYRIVIRSVANSTNERTLIAAIAPSGVVCHESLHTIRPYRIDPEERDLEEHPIHSVYKHEFADRELFVALGLLNSVPFDYLTRTRVDANIIQINLRESQLPRLIDGDGWFEYIWMRAARLNCYGDAFAEMRDRLGRVEPATETAERRRLQAEIDAAAFHAYGLDRAETKFVLDDFHRVKDPRVMTEAYFDSVLEYYDDLSERGPSPQIKPTTGLPDRSV